MRRQIALIAFALLLIPLSLAVAQNNPAIAFDENGRATLTFPGGSPIPAPCSIQADAGPGGKPAVLFCSLLGPPSLVTGDVIITETGGGISDVLRFAFVGPTAGFFIYSDNADGVDAIADVGLPTAFNTNTVTIPEVGPEGSGTIFTNGVTYTPTAGQPGFVAGFQATYIFTSDQAVNAAVPSAFQIDYLPAQVGGGIAGGYIDISNSGGLGADAFGPLSGTTGRICVNVYVFTADEQETECCSCLVTPNALVHLTASDLIGNPGNGVTPTLGVVVKLLATIPGTTTTAAGVGTQTTFTGSACNAALPFTALNIAPGMEAWATKFHTNSTTIPASISLTETKFSNQLLSQGELTKLTNLCQFLSGNQSGAGLCKACSLGGLGAGRR